MECTITLKLCAGCRFSPPRVHLHTFLHPQLHGWDDDDGLGAPEVLCKDLRGIDKPSQGGYKEGEGLP